MNATPLPSINRLVHPVVESLQADAQTLRLGLERDASGVALVDGGIDVPGGIEAGRRIAEICMGGLGRVRLDLGAGAWPAALTVSSSQPWLACLCGQYAGWSLSHGTGKGAWFSLGSGPARALAAKEDLFNELGYRDQAPHGVLVLEVDARPPREVVDKVLHDCGLAPDGLTIILTPTRSLAGTTQVVARVLEVALHKVHALGFDPRRVLDGVASAPLPAPGRDFLTAMARTNDAILYGGSVHLVVDAGDDEARDLARRLPSSSSRDYGRSFGELFKEAKYDFYQLDPMLFAPARVLVSSTASGNTFAGGALNMGLLEPLWLAA